MAVIGYARVSLDKERADLQFRSLIDLVTPERVVIARELRGGDEVEWHLAAAASVAGDSRAPIGSGATVIGVERQ